MATSKPLIIESGMVKQSDPNTDTLVVGNLVVNGTITTPLEEWRNAALDPTNRPTFRSITHGNGR